MSPFGGPAAVKGIYESWRNVIHAVLIAIFITLPWIKLNGQPLLLFDISQRHFIIFGLNFYSHEAPLLFFFLILVLLIIFLVTALYGRLWCGWACPQTVFLHGVFNRIEKWVLGSYTERRLLELEENSVKRFWKKGFMYVIFFAVCWVMTHSFAAYFIGATTITQFLQDGPADHLQIFLVLMTLTLTFFLNFAFFRQNLCNYVCPYGRFQNALIDGNSVVVAYDAVRGETRGKLSAHVANQGDCIDCNRCVAVCPANIDIRNGFQLECIACAKCIDACNDVMVKVNKPKYLIRYQTGNQKKINYKRFRILLYSLLIVIFSLAFVWTLASREIIDFSMTRTHTTPFVTRTEDTETILQNRFNLHLKNQSSAAIKVEIAMSAADADRGFKLISPAASMTLDAQQDLKVPAFIEIDNLRFNDEAAEVEINLKTPQDIQVKKMKFIRGH